MKPLSEKKKKYLDELTEEAGGAQAVRRKMGIAIPSGFTCPAGQMKNVKKQVNDNDS